MRNTAHPRPARSPVEISTGRAVLAGVEQIGAQLDEQVHEHPMRSVGLALGVGYVLGGGLFSGLTARLLGLGVTVGLRMLATSINVNGAIDGKEMAR